MSRQSDLIGGGGLPAQTASLIFKSEGTFTANGATNVVVSDKAFTTGTIMLCTLKTVGGTVGAIPTVKTYTSGTSFTVAGTALDTSVYSYVLI